MKKNYKTIENNLFFLNGFSNFKNPTKYKIFKKLLLTFLTLFTINLGFGQVTTDTFNTTGAATWTAPCGVTSISVEAWGAGGAGGGNTANSSLGGGGGAGGTYVRSTLVVVPGTTYNLFVAPGNNGTTTAGAKGQGSWFNTNAILFAEGGNGGAAPNGAGGAAGGLGSITSSIGTVRTAGANGANGTALIGGAGGAGSTGGGAGGVQRTTENDGANGTAIGGGGGGAFIPDATNHIGGNGARGEVRITYTNVIPANPGNPTSNSPQCNPPGVTLTRVGVPPAGVTWYWQTTPGGTNTTNSGNTFVVNTSGTYYIRAQHNVSGCWSIGEGSLTVTVNQPPGAIAGGSATVCNGSSTPAFTNPVGGGTWSVTNGTGSATITGAGILTGTGAGTVTVNYTIGVCPAATFAVTVNPIPAAIGGGAANICIGTPSPAFTNATGGGTWSITNGTGSATISAGGVATGVSVGTATVVYTVAGCSRTTPITIFSTPTITVNPIDTSTAVGGAASFSVTAINGPTSYTWQVSTDGGATWTTVTNGGVYSNATTATLNITGAILAMNGYQYHASATNTCGTSTYSTPATLSVNNLVLVSGLGTNNVTCGVNSILRDHANLGNYAINRNDWSALNVTSAAVVNINGTYDTENGFDGVWLYDGVGIGGTLLAVYTGVGTINYTGNPGQTITVRFSSDNTTNRPGFDLNVTYTGNCNVPCAVPTAQPTALTLIPSGTVISGAFTHAAPQPDNYLVVISTNPVAPNPVNGTTYAIGATVGAGYIVADNDANNTFSATGLTVSTTYYIYIFSFNKLCIGGPLYLGASPLTGSTTTLGSNPYCLATSNVSTRYIENVFTVGAITNLNNMGTGRTPTGYADFTASTPVTQIPGGGVAIDYLLRVSRQYIEMWVDWNNDGIFTDAAPEMVYNSGSTLTIEGTGGFVVPPATLPGNYRIRIRTLEGSPTIDPCTSPYATGETEDYRLTVVADCAAKPTFVHDGERCDDGIVALGVEGAPGVTQFRFYNSLYGGTLIGTQAAVPGITYWNTPFLSATTKYYVTAWNGSCESWYRQEIVATINPTTNIIVTPSVPEVCGENNIVQITAGGDVITDYLVNENFEAGTLGTMSLFNVAADANTQWTNRVSPYVPTGTVWKPAITSSAIGNRFALANSDFVAPNPKDTQLRTAVLNASVFTDLTLDFRHHFSYYPGEPVQFAFVDISTNGAAGPWTTLQTYTSNQGFAGEFTNSLVNLNAYAGQANLMVRFRYSLGGGSAWANGWAVDDVKIYGTRPLNTTFTWTGGTVNAYIDAACTIPYAAQSVTTVYVQPTPLQLASTSWSFTANATLGNGCPVSELITITNKTKLWKGTVNTDWNQPNNWEPAGVPDANTCVIIYDGPNDSRIIGSFYNAFAKYVIIRPNGDLLVNTDNTLTITDNLNVEVGGIATFDSGSSLIQTNNTANIGNITYRRTANIRRQDYVYWSSPVSGFSNNAISPGTPLGFQYKWLPTTGGINGFGNWTSANETMTNGKGYIVRGPNAFSTSVLTNYTTSFVGVPNNGDVTIPISRGTYAGPNYSTGVSSTPGTEDDDNWNLVGNPYPSSIDAIDFLTLNSNIDGFVNIWTHGTLPSTAIADPFYNDYAYNYTPTDYITYNASGASSGPGVFNGLINAGQGFFVSMLHSSAATTENLTFNNSLRSNTYNNNVFYKTSNGKNENAKVSEKHRIWFDLISPSGSSIRSLLGYIENATNEKDRLFDAFSNEKLSFNIFSMIDEEQMLIQGRKLPFDINDKVNIGTSIPQDGLYKIALSSVDGLFSNKNQNIYLEDKLLNIIYNLNDAPYSFMANKGIIKDRFVLRFSKDTKTNITEITNQVMVFDNDILNVESGKLKIKKIQIFDILGKEILNKDNISNKIYQINTLTRSNNLIIVKVTLEDDSIETRKVIY